jgi:hypothetical protein
MNPRQAAALARPLNRASDALDPTRYRRRTHKTGIEVSVLLAVDRRSRINAGRPVWHVSVTLWSRGRKVDLPAIAEHTADAAALAGVGSTDHEWWVWSPALVGNLRVPLTDQENAAVPPGQAYDDAGETGARRPRTLRPPGYR